MGGWGQGPARVGSGEGVAEGCGEPLGLEAGGLAWETGAERQVGPAACWLPLVLRLHQLGEGGFASPAPPKRLFGSRGQAKQGSPRCQLCI